MLIDRHNSTDVDAWDLPTFGPQSQASKTSARNPVAETRQSSEYWLYAFLVVQFLCQSALMIEWVGGAGLRTYVRAATYFSSLAMLGLLPGRCIRQHPARLAAVAMLGIMGLGLLHPNANPVAGIAHWLLNISVWAPLFWVGRIRTSKQALNNTLVLLWLFNVLGSVIGVLQVYYPERFSPSAEFIRSLNGVFADGLLIERIDGKQIWRPCGLSDTPGGAAISGSFAVIVGFVMYTLSSRKAIRALAVMGIFSGVFCIYVCEVRSILIITVMGAAVLLALQVAQGKLTRAAATMLIIPIVVAGGITWTKSIGSERVGERVRSLSRDSATNIYYQNRGHFLENALFEELPKYPLGAGLGRYGMMFLYFGDPSIPGSHELWAEIQLTGWLYDGGLPLILLGYGALSITCLTTLRISLSKRIDSEIRDLASVVTALNAGWLTVTFNCPFFLGQQGMIFWLMNAAVFAVVAAENRSAFRGFGSRTFGKTTS